MSQPSEVGAFHSMGEDRDRIGKPDETRSFAPLQTVSRHGFLTFVGQTDDGSEPVELVFAKDESHAQELAARFVLAHPQCCGLEIWQNAVRVQSLDLARRPDRRDPGPNPAFS